MKWTKLTIDTTCEAEDLISAFLEEEGVLGVQIEDNIPLTEEEMETMFVDLLPDDMPEMMELQRYPVSLTIHLTCRR